MIYDILIIGSGMAGMTAALYAKRNNKTVMLIEKETIGGQIASSPRVENFPTQGSISGLELADLVFGQIEGYVDFEFTEVSEVKKVDDLFEVKTADGCVYNSLTVIVANGVKHRRLRLEGEEDLIGNGVSYCAVCDGAFYEGKDVVLVGDANTALQYALMLSDLCKNVYICTLFDKFFGDKIYVEAIKERANIKVRHNLNSVKYLYDDKLNGIVFKDTVTGEEVVYKCDGVFIAIGQIPDNKAYSELADLDKFGYFVADESCKTRTEGLFVAGDTRTKGYRQLTTAAADGATAALAACDYIFKKGK